MATAQEYPLGTPLGAPGAILNNPGAAQPRSPLEPTPDPATELYKALSRQHPDYVAWADRWRIYRDCVDDSEFEKEFYLHRNEREQEDQWRFRVQISEFLPDTPSYVERIVGALYAEKPKRDFKREKRLEEFSESVTLSKRSSCSSMDDAMERVARQLLTYGTTRILVTARSAPAGASRAEEQAAGARPYLVLYTPLSVIDWDEDDSHELTMVRVREEYCRKVNPADPRVQHVRHVKFIQYDRAGARWWVFHEDEEEKGKFILDEEGDIEHGLGIVPMVVRYWPDETRTMIGKAYIRYMARAEVSKFRNDSDLDYDTHMHAHPSLVIWTFEKALKEITIAGGRYFRLNPGDNATQKEDMAYLDFPTPAIDALKLLVESKRQSVKRFAQLDPAATTEEETRPTQSPSGVSRAWSFGTSEARILSSLADAMADIEAAIFDLVIRYYGEQPDAKTGVAFQGEVQYPEEFDVAAASALLEEIEQAGGSINSPTLLRYMHKRYARAKAGDAGAEILAKIDSEIDRNPVLAAAVRTEADVMSFPGGAGADEEDMVSEEEEDAPATARPPARSPRARRARA